MVKVKKAREKGKISFSRFFKKFSEGDSVAVVRELSIPSNFPERLQGRTGVIESKLGKSYFVKIKDQNKEKRFLIEPIHLREIKHSKENDKR